MPKIRTIKPEFWTDEEIVRLSRDARLFFIGLWNFVDDDGVFEWKPLSLKLKILPNDDVNVESLLDELLLNKRLDRFVHNDREYGIVIHFSKHQKVDSRFRKTIIKDLTEVYGDYAGSTPRPQRIHDAGGGGGVGGGVGGGGEGDVSDACARDDGPAAPPPSGDVCLREGGSVAGDKAEVRRKSEALIAAWTGYGLVTMAQDVELLCPSAGFLVQFEPEMPEVAETYGQAAKAVRMLNDRLKAAGKPKLKTFDVHKPLNFHQMFLARAAGGRRTWRDYVGKDAWYVLDADDQKRVRAALAAVPDLLKDFPAFA